MVQRVWKANGLQPHRTRTFKLSNDKQFVEKLADVVGLYLIPTSSSWLNLIERWFSELTDKAIRRGTFQNVGQLIDTVARFVEAHNQNPTSFT